MALFDIQTFNQDQVNGTATFTLADGSIETMTQHTDIYTQQIQAPNSVFSTNCAFFVSNLSLKSQGSYFYDNPTGVFNVYDEQGNLISQTNYDSPYGFSIQNLIDLFKNNYQIDLTDASQNISVYRSAAGVSPRYSIKIPYIKQFYRYILIDGNSGNVITDATGAYIK